MYRGPGCDLPTNENVPCILYDFHFTNPPDRRETGSDRQPGFRLDGPCLARFQSNSCLSFMTGGLHNAAGGFPLFYYGILMIYNMLQLPSVYILSLFCHE